MSGVSTLESRINEALAEAGQKRLMGDLRGAREVALSILAIDEEHREARRLLATLALQAAESPTAPAATPKGPVPTDAPAWPSVVVAAKASSAALEPRAEVGGAVAPNKPASSKSPRRSGMLTVASVGVLAVAVGAALLLYANRSRNDPAAAPAASSAPPIPASSALPAAPEPTNAPSQAPAAAKPLQPDLLRNPESLLARRDFVGAQRAVGDGLPLDPSEPALLALQKRIQADARRAAKEVAADVRDARSGAERARAADLASRPFQQASDLETEAGRLYDRQLWPETLAKYQEALHAYKEALGQAQAEASRLEHEQAKARTAEAEQARRAAAEPAPATRPTASTAPPSAPAASSGRQDDRAAILAVVDAYTAALQAKDLAALKALWPSLGGAQEAKVRSAFEFAKSLRVRVEVGSVLITDGSAVVSCRRKDSVVTQEGQMFQSDRAAVIRLVKNSQGWSIAAIE